MCLVLCGGLVGVWLAREGARGAWTQDRNCVRLIEGVYLSLEIHGGLSGAFLCVLLFEDTSYISPPYSPLHSFPAPLLHSPHTLPSFLIPPHQWIRDPGRAAPRAWWH